MGITDRTRKLLWGRSGNRCALCKAELIMHGTATNDESVMGEECHIVSKKPGGPRCEPDFPEEKLDAYQNLILLCRVHHKLVDDQPGTHTSDRLREMKTKHEQWVSDALRGPRKVGEYAIKRVKGNVPRYLIRLTTRKELINIVTGACESDFDNEELETEGEVHLVSLFLQEVSDFADIGAELESGERVRMKHRLSQKLKELNENGFWVFGAREIRILEVQGEKSEWPVAILRVLRKGNAGIVRLNPEKQNGQ